LLRIVQDFENVWEQDVVSPPYDELLTSKDYMYMYMYMYAGKLEPFTFQNS
jgi:hypothetical protein